MVRRLLEAGPVHALRLQRLGHVARSPARRCAAGPDPRRPGSRAPGRRRDRCRPRPACAGAPASPRPWPGACSSWMGSGPYSARVRTGAAPMSNFSTTGASASVGSSDRVAWTRSRTSWAATFTSLSSENWTMIWRHALHVDGAQRLHAAERVERLLERIADVVLHRLRVRARQDGGDGDDGEVHVGAGRRQCAGGRRRPHHGIRVEERAFDEDSMGRCLERGKLEERRNPARSYWTTWSAVPFWSGRRVSHDALLGWQLAPRTKPGSTRATTSRRSALPILHHPDEALLALGLDGLRGQEEPRLSPQPSWRILEEKSTSSPGLPLAVAPPCAGPAARRRAPRRSASAVDGGARARHARLEGSAGRVERALEPRAAHLIHEGHSGAARRTSQACVLTRLKMAVRRRVVAFVAAAAGSAP